MQKEEVGEEDANLISKVLFLFTHKEEVDRKCEGRNKKEEAGSKKGKKQKEETDEVSGELRSLILDVPF